MVMGGIARARGSGPFHTMGPAHRLHSLDMEDPDAVQRAFWDRYAAWRGAYFPSAGPSTAKQPKFDANKSHPRKMDPGYRKDIVPPDEVVNVDQDSADDDEEVPVCAGCDKELFLGNETDKDHARPYALKCGHLICAECASARKARKKPKAKKGYRSKKSEAAEEVGFAKPWEGCPVKSCNGGGTAWHRKVGSDDGLWDVYL